MQSLLGILRSAKMLQWTYDKKPVDPDEIWVYGLEDPGETYCSFCVSNTELLISLFTFPPHSTVPGYGTLLAKTLELWARQVGLQRIRVPHALGSPQNKKWTGYYFWPRMGYDGKLSSYARKKLTRHGIPARDLVSVQTVFQKYPILWREHGAPLSNLTLELQ